MAANVSMKCVMAIMASNENVYQWQTGNLAQCSNEKWLAVKINGVM